MHWQVLLPLPMRLGCLFLFQSPLCCETIEFCGV
jgi:hypothetical protein